MSLDACKRGLLAACRPIICLDGSHIKTKYGGIILTAVGIDPNDCIFPIAWAIVEVESLGTWKWFLQTLKQDLGIDNTTPWTIMTDKQKGLIPAVQQVFPESEHRFCVRHLYNNFQQQFKGENLKNQLWKCARSSSVSQWNRNMDKMKALDHKAHAWLEKMPPNTWCRAFFSTFPKCDILLNNACEVFNNYILEAREMPILSMLEAIRCKLMGRFYNKEREVGQEWYGAVCPKIRKKVQKNLDWSNSCYPLPSGQGIFQVHAYDYNFIVDIEAKTCSCRRWDLTGIPCPHAISCLRHERIAVESVLPECYSTNSYVTAYGQAIWPVKDKSEWENVTGNEILPPVYEKRVGRPRKSRRKEPMEIQGPNGTRLSKHGVTMNCSYCGGSGHNKRGCALKKAGIIPEMFSKQAAGVSTTQDGSGPSHMEEYDDHAQTVMFFDASQPPPLSQLTDTMLSQMENETTNTRDFNQGPLPDSTFIATNQPTARPIPPTTATRVRKPSAKAKEAAQQKKPAPAKKVGHVKRN